MHVFKSGHVPDIALMNVEGRCTVNTRAEVPVLLITGAWTSVRRSADSRVLMLSVDCRVRNPVLLAKSLVHGRVRITPARSLAARCVHVCPAICAAQTYYRAGINVLLSAERIALTNYVSNVRQKTSSPR